MFFGSNKMVVKSPRSKMVIGNSLFYPIVGFASFAVFIYMSFGDLWMNFHGETKLSFVERNGTQFLVEGQAFYVNGWNSYWLMDHAVDENRRPRIRAILQAGAKMGLTVCRAWAFNDGAYNALQISPGKFDEKVFTALDHVIAEARKYRIRLLLSLVNNLHAYGGKTQYVKWAWEEGVGVSSSNDSFFYDPTTRLYFKNYVKTVLTRKNTFTGIEYRDDPTIFAWELINEPRCLTDPSGDTLQDWIEEMSTFIKSIDRNHLLTVGHEGFYGPKSSKSVTVNPEFWAADLGADFIRNSEIPTVDFASVHVYPDQWLRNQSFEEKVQFVRKWLLSHIHDGDKVLKKPVMFTEFGLSTENKEFDPEKRDKFFKVILDIIYKSARRNLSGAGSFFWQFLVEGMEEYNDDFGIVPWERPSTYQLITEHSCRLAKLHCALSTQKVYLKSLCSSHS
nr:mannan endo-1,4-beta-mannosidase 2-like [Ipomoea batatas]